METGTNRGLRLESPGQDVPKNTPKSLSGWHFRMEVTPGKPRKQPLTPRFVPVSLEASTPSTWARRRSIRYVKCVDMTIKFYIYYLKLDDILFI
jgi:hypothetical protein